MLNFYLLRNVAPTCQNLRLCWLALAWMLCLLLPSVGRADQLYPEPNNPPSGPALIFIHGWTNDRFRWDEPIRLLREKQPALLRKFRIYRYEYTWSQPIEVSGLNLDNEIRRVLEPQQLFVIVAHSMGGLVARSALENYTGQTSVFENPLHPTDEAAISTRRLFSKPILKTVFSSYTPSMSFEKSSAPTVHKIGYARVSTREQNLDLQTAALRAVGCDRIFEETMSGSKRERPELNRALDHLRAGDTLVVWKLDRLGRSVKDLVELVGELESRGVHFQSTTDSIDTGTPAGRFFFHVMASLAQMERELLIERTRAGLDAARAQGRVGGRKRVMNESKLEAAKKLLASGAAPREVAKNLGISVPTLYRWIPAGERESP